MGRISAAELQSYNESLMGDYLTSSEDEVIPEEPIIEATEDVDKVQMVWTLLTFMVFFLHSTVCFLNKWPKNKCKGNFGTSFLKRPLCGCQHFVLHDNSNNRRLQRF